MSNIYDSPFSFILVKRYITFAFKRFYGEYIVVGKENIPTDCPVIYAPNHTNALMDALAIHAILPANMPVIFLARSDIFNNKMAAKALNFAKIMPAFRMRDGVENLGRNQYVFDKCVDVLHHNKSLGIMPEGGQEIERFLRPIVKGIFRIAFSAQQKYGNKPGIKIVPVGLDFGSITKFGKHIIINIGKPIEVSEYMDIHTENQAIATNEIRERLRTELIGLTLNLETDTHYECFEIATEVCNLAFLNRLKLPDNTINRFIARQKIAESLIALEKNSSERIETLDAVCHEYADSLKNLRLKNWNFEKASYNSLSIIINGLLLLCTFPFFLVGLLLNFLPFFVPVYLRKNVIKVQFVGFFSSLQFVLGLITFPVFYTIQGILFYSFTDFPWWASLLFVVCQYPIGKVALKWNGEFKKWLAKIRYLRLERKHHEKIHETKRMHKQIISLLTE